MCGQYFFEDDPLALDLKELLAQLRARVRTTSLEEDSLTTGRICPADAVPAFVDGAAAMMQWGFHLPDNRLLPDDKHLSDNCSAAARQYPVRSYAPVCGYVLPETIHLSPLPVCTA